MAYRHYGYWRSSGTAASMSYRRYRTITAGLKPLLEDDRVGPVSYDATLYNTCRTRLLRVPYSRASPYTVSIDNWASYLPRRPREWQPRITANRSAPRSRRPTRLSVSTSILRPARFSRSMRTTA